MGIYRSGQFRSCGVYDHWRIYNGFTEPKRCALGIGFFNRIGDRGFIGGGDRQYGAQIARRLSGDRYHWRIGDGASICQ